MEFLDFDDAARWIRDQRIAMIDLKFGDLWGRWRHVTLPAARFTPRLLGRGVGFDGSSVGFKSVSSGDMLLVPDLGAAFLDPFPEVPTLSFICRTMEAGDTHRPFRNDPRNVAQLAEEFLVRSGVADRSVWGPEFEFYIFDSVQMENTLNTSSYRMESTAGVWRLREPGSGYVVPPRGGYHAVPPHDHLNDARNRISVTLEGMGVEVKYHHHEVGGPGQCEIEIPLQPMMRAADTAMLVKYAVRNTAQRLGMTATFLPKPLHGEAGSGMHYHQCLWKDDTNTFFDPTGYGKTSEVARQFIAGILQHGGAVMALTNPSTNSYRRLVPGFEAPVSAIFSLGNRSAAIRIPRYANEAESVRFEFRSPDATGNVYLSMAAQLMAGLDGVKRKLDPKSLGFGPFDEDVGALPPEQRATIKALPTSLGQALDALDADRDFLLAGGVFDAEMLDSWIAKKRQEERDVLNRPHPYEVELYYDL